VQEGIWYFLLYFVGIYMTVFIRSIVLLVVLPIMQGHIFLVVKKRI